MRISALITAAGMSSRMGSFKPMLNIGEISVAQRIIATFHQAGIRHIVMITGYKAVELEKHLADSGIIFLRNDRYETTQMFDSVKIGLDYLKDKCDKVLLTPVDIPLFTARTVKRLIESEKELACPSHDGKTGHPILIGSGIIDRILEDEGEEGLFGALQRCGVAMSHIPVKDGGILHDADTPQDYQALLRYHNQMLVRPVVKVSLSREKVFFDEKMARFLSQVHETSSVRDACRRLQISYSTGWNMIRRLESQMKIPLIRRTQGGAGGGRSSLTPEGLRLIEKFRQYEEVLNREAAQHYEEYFGEFFRNHNEQEEGL